MYWCDVCKCWLNDTKAARLNHERGAGHQAKLEKSEWVNPGTGSVRRRKCWAKRRSELARNARRQAVWIKYCDTGVAVCGHVRCFMPQGPRVTSGWVPRELRGVQAMQAAGRPATQ